MARHKHASRFAGLATTCRGCGETGTGRRFGALTRLRLMDALSEHLRRCSGAVAGLAIALAGCAGAGDQGSSEPAVPIESDVSSPSSMSSGSALAPPGLAGGWLMFSRFDESTHTFLSTHLIRPDGSGEVDLPLPGPEGGGRWSRDGSLIAVMTVLDDERIGTAIIRADGTVDRILQIPDETLNAVCTVWSPDDMRLACEAWDDTDASRGGIYSVRASDGGDLTRLSTAPDGMSDLPGDYSPDGRELVFKRMSGEGDGPLFIVDVAGGGEPHALGERTFEDPGRFSPDGALVLTSAAGQIMLVGLDGSVQQTIEGSDAYLFGPCWSPDGEWIAYSSTSGGFIADIIISRLDGSERWQVTQTPDNEIRVEWGPAP